MWKPFKQYFIFAKGERLAIIALVVIILSIFLLPRLYYYFKPVSVEQIDLKYRNEIDSFKRELAAAKGDTFNNDLEEETHPNYTDAPEKPHYAERTKRAPEYFEFDPNKIGEEEWLRLGLSEHVAKTIEKYKAHGGTFRKPQDLSKIYTLDANDYNRLLPYIHIQKVEKEITTATTREESQHNEVYSNREAVPKTAFAKPIFDINIADSTNFESLRGIGPVLAARIIKYRESLGGFVKIEQIGEVWHLPDSVYQQLKPQFIVHNVSVRKININTADNDILYHHPYIRKLARWILAYRKNVGEFKQVHDLKSVAEMTDSIYWKLVPYVCLQ